MGQHCRRFREAVCRCAIRDKPTIKSCVLPDLIVYQVAGELIVSRYVATSITTDAGRFGHVGLCQLRTKLVYQVHSWWKYSTVYHTKLHWNKLLRINKYSACQAHLIRIIIKKFMLFLLMKTGQHNITTYQSCSNEINTCSAWLWKRMNYNSIFHSLSLVNAL